MLALRLNAGKSKEGKSAGSVIVAPALPMSWRAPSNADMMGAVVLLRK